MIKKILFIASFIIVGFASAQSLQIMDADDVDISGTTHYQYGNNSELEIAKFHIRNLTGADQPFAIKVSLAYANDVDLGVCFGLACFSADKDISGTQVLNNGVGDIIAANDIYTNLKVGPFAWQWSSCPTDSAVWTVTAFDPANPSDSSSATIIWRCGDVPTSVEEISKEDVKLSAYPNPAKNSLNVEYTIKGSFSEARIDLFDVLGQRVASKSLNSDKGVLKMDIERLNAGIYFYAIKVDEKTIRTERVIVQ
jgi:hypothetical protein